MTKYEITIINTTYTRVGDEYQTVETKQSLILNFDEMQDLIALLVEGSDKAIKLEIKTIRED